MLAAPHLATSGQVMHKASTYCRQPALSATGHHGPALPSNSFSVFFSAFLLYVQLALAI